MKWYAAIRIRIENYNMDEFHKQNVKLRKPNRKEYKYDSTDIKYKSRPKCVDSSEALGLGASYLSVFSLQKPICLHTYVHFSGCMFLFNLKEAENKRDTRLSCEDHCIYESCQ